MHHKLRFMHKIFRFMFIVSDLIEYSYILLLFPDGFTVLCNLSRNNKIMMNELTNV